MAPHLREVTAGSGLARAPSGQAVVNPEGAETYLRLLAEAELQRAQALPRRDSGGRLAGPLRQGAGAARQALGPVAAAAQRIAPVAGEAGRRLAPAAGRAARALRPITGQPGQRRALADQAGQRLDSAGLLLEALADRAAEALRPAAARAGPATEAAARVIVPAADQVIRAVTPAAGQAARAAAPAARQVAETWQQLENWRQQATAGWRYRAGRHEYEMSAQQSEERLEAVADALVRAGALDAGTVGSILTGFATALAARSRIGPEELRHRLAWGNQHSQQPVRAPAGRYRAVPVSATVPAVPASGLGETRLFMLVIAPDRAQLTVAGTMPAQPVADLRGHRYPYPLPSWHRGGARPAGTDDRGASYRAELDGWGSDSEGNWSGVLVLTPTPAPGAQWLELTLAPGAEPVRIDLASAGPPGTPAAAGGTGPADGSSPAGGSGPGSQPDTAIAELASAHPVGRLFDVRAERLLLRKVSPDRAELTYLAEDETGDLAEDETSGSGRITDLIGALTAADVLADAQPAMDRYIALAQRVGARIPAELSRLARPADLPAAWENVLANRLCRDGPDAFAAAGGVLPEVGGTRFVVAGLTSSADSAELQVLSWGLATSGWQQWPHREESWSWWARDDTGRWHVGEEGGGGFSDTHGRFEMRLHPPIPPAARALEVIVTGPAGQAATSVPLDWQERA